MNPTNSRPKKSPSSKTRRKPERGCVRSPSRSTSPRRHVPGSSVRSRRDAPAARRKEFRAWRKALPTALERDTLLMPDVIAENVVQEATAFLGEEFPARYTVWLAAKAELCYSARRQFYRRLRGGDDAREWLRVYMRHWLAALLGLERPDLHQCLPVEFGNGQQLPPGLHPRLNRLGLVRDLLPNPRAWDATRVTRHSRWAWLATSGNGSGRTTKRHHRHGSAASPPH